MICEAPSNFKLYGFDPISYLKHAGASVSQPATFPGLWPHSHPLMLARAIA